MLLRLGVKYYRKYELFWKYCIGGGMSLLIDVGLLYVFTDFLHIHYLISATLSFIIAASYNYTFQKVLTFKNKDQNCLKQFMSFVAIALIGLGLNIILLKIQVEWFGIWYILAKIIAAAIVLIWNFLANKFFTFKEIIVESARALDEAETQIPEIENN